MRDVRSGLLLTILAAAACAGTDRNPEPNAADSSAAVTVAPVAPPPRFSVAASPPSSYELPRLGGFPPARRLDFIPAARMAEARERVLRVGAVGTTVFTAADQQTTYTMVVRTTPSEIEEHSRWDDIVVVTRGRGVLEFSRSARDQHLRAPGELRGGEYDSEAYRLPIEEGDITRIPAAVPHSFVPVDSLGFEYLIIKVRRPGLPLRGSEP